MRRINNEMRINIKEIKGKKRDMNRIDKSWKMRITKMKNGIGRKKRERNEAKKRKLTMKKKNL